ncbi:MAG TPA: FAD-dependent monooxygenase [Chloroflexota bacterium]|jgi:salicylate hydroxylase|nr:FAD-dependent monooxygenase [Chloroflexota bacterium]
MARKPKVAIIGGGIGGCVAAHALIKKGIDVHVYEAQPELKEIGAGVALGPNAMKALRWLGLEDKIREIGYQREHTYLLSWKSGRVISEGSPAEAERRYGAAGCTIHRADLLDVLAQALPKEIVTAGSRGVEVGTRGDVAWAKFKDGTEIEADAVIGADGIHSAVRASLFGPDAPRFTGKICYRSVIPADAIPGGPYKHQGTWLGPHGAIVIYGVRRGELINVVAHHDDDNYKSESWITECPREEPIQRYSQWHESLARLFSASEIWYKWALYDRDPIPQWTKDRATVLGDAAHPMLPYLGQGACQAMEDGCVLAQALDSMPEDVPGALQLYERSRRPRASQVVLEARARGVDNHLVSPMAALKRDALIWIRRHITPDQGGRGLTWIPSYDPSSPSVLAA